MRWRCQSESGEVSFSEVTQLVPFGEQLFFIVFEDFRDLIDSSFGSAVFALMMKSTLADVENARGFNHL